MRVVDAHWELRNLGLRTLEIEFETADLPETISKLLDENSNVIVVAKVPVGHVGLHHQLARHGFVFCESMIDFRHDLHDVELSSALSRLSGNVQVASASRSQVPVILENVTSGMFTTDRISLHPRFSSVTANRRYANWLRDELEQGANLMQLIYRDQVVAFFSFRIVSADEPVIALSGVFPGLVLPGMGSVLQAKILEHARQSGCRALSTRVSTNTPAAIKTHLDLDFSVGSIWNIFMRVPSTYVESGSNEFQ